MEAAVGRAVVQSTSAVNTAAAAAEAAHQQTAAGSNSGRPAPAATGSGSSNTMTRDGAVQARPAGFLESMASAATTGSSMVIESIKEEEARANRAVAEAHLHDRRVVGLFDARYHSTSW